MFISPEWIVYPNPSAGQLHIELKTDSKSAYRIIGILGQLVREGEYVQGDHIDLHGVQSGAYYIQLWQAKEYLGVQRFTILK